MNPAPPPQPPQPHRPSTSCHRHPDEQFTGFCPSCLCERLTVLHPTTPSSSSIVPARKSTSSTAAAALRSVFRQSSSSFFPELRRSKSFSASKANEALSGAFEPQRKSCDVRVRGANFNLFNQDNSNNEKKIEAVDCRNQASSSSNIQVPKEEEEENNEDVIIVVEEEPEPNVCSVSEEIEIAEEEGEELKTMKDHIDLDSSQTKKPKGSFWSAASVFSKKLQKWRQKQKDAKKQRREGALPAGKPTGRHFRETQSEVADYGFGRRSCDVDPRFSLDAAGPRFSLDAGRMSSDDPRYSIDEPRASLDGYLIGRAGFPRMPTMLSVVEDAPPPPVNVLRTDAQIPVEEPPVEDDAVPGGSAQTREYYSDSSSRRRKSLDRSSSARKSEIGGDELIRSVSNGSIIGNAKVAAAGVAAGVDFIHGAKMGFQDRGDDCCSEVYGNGERKEEKKSRRWSIWGLIHRRGRNKDEDDGKCSRVNGVERCFSEDHLRGGGLGGRVWRSNSSVSWRNTQAFTGSLGTQSQRRNINGVQGNGNGKKGKDEFVLERNRSARYSPSSVDNGLLRFYLAPMGGGGRRNGSVNGRSNQAQSIARSVIGLY